MLPSEPEDPLPTLAEARAEAEAQVILAALERAGGKRKLAARMLGLSDATFYRKLAALRKRTQHFSAPGPDLPFSALGRDLHEPR